MKMDFTTPALLLLQISSCICIRLTELTVPPHKLVGESVKLVCKFEMEAEHLYSVKWYRNEQEFYRYVPNDRPKLQIFPQKGIKVERSKSSRQHVFLSNLELEASGTYRCEVSGEAPSFKTKHEEKTMIVVQEPHANEITGVKARYFTGDLVNVTCYSRGSSPPAELHWKINKLPVLDEIQRPPYFAHPDDMSEISFQMLQSQGDTYPEIKEEYGKLHSWVDKHEKFPHLDTTASNLQFIVRKEHRQKALALECIASIGKVYWHVTEEVCHVSAKPREIPGWLLSSRCSSLGTPALLKLSLLNAALVYSRFKSL